MAKAFIHADNCVRKWGGIREDYQPISDLMDSTKATSASLAHRWATHNTWFIYNVIPVVFGDTFINSDGREVSTKDVAELHCFDDYGFIPSLSDFTDKIEIEDWMFNGRGTPPSNAKMAEWKGNRNNKPQYIAG